MWGIGLHRILDFLCLVPRLTCSKSGKVLIGFVHALFLLQTFEATFVVICPDDQQSPDTSDVQSVCQDIVGSAEVDQCSSANSTFSTAQDSSADSSR